MTPKNKPMIPVTKGTRLKKAASSISAKASLFDDSVVQVSDILQKIRILAGDVEELKLEFADHDLELHDLLRTTFCSYGRRRERRQ